MDSTPQYVPVIVGHCRGMNSSTIHFRRLQEHRATSQACAKQTEGWSSTWLGRVETDFPRHRTRIEVCGWVCRQQEVVLTNHFLSIFLAAVGVLLLYLESIKTFKVIHLYASPRPAMMMRLRISGPVRISSHRQSHLFGGVGLLQCQTGWGGKAEERHTGRDDIGKRNDKGNRMVAIVVINKLLVGNIWFRKKAGRG